MITEKNKVFRLDTPNTTYVFRVNALKQLEHLYYGARLQGELNDIDFILGKQGTGQGTAISMQSDDGKIFPDNTCYECSNVGRGDYRENIVTVCDNLNSTVCEFTYDGFELIDNHEIPNLPNSHGKEQTLALYLKDTIRKVKLTLYYSTLADCDVIVKSVAVTNEGEGEIRLLRVMSNQLDLDCDEFTLDTLDGAWARERYITSEKLRVGITKIDSKRGVSSNCHNPYVVLKKNDCNLHHGEAYGFNLVYSGCHAEIFDKTPLGKVRVLNGLNDTDFCWHLYAGETFYTPEATLCYSNNGTNTLSERYHRFVNEHIIPTQWAYRERPILVNNWEATYFNFTEKKLLDIAKKAKSLGVELFVLDDGWFGKRTSDSKGLGDWTENKHRLPKGLNGLAQKINQLGLQFGVWVEPEMVNPDSDLFRAHPNWAVQHPNYTPLECRNQLLLDLCNDEVCDYIIDAMSKVFSSANISYVKWDFNRPLTDCYSVTLGNRQGEFNYRFMCGFYRILNELTHKFPNILFEGCASGGNRFDLGVLAYMPQIWCSDNTDSFDRVRIHEGTLTGYPQSCIGSHVSASPNHQTLRISTIDNRFNTACIGAFGYELDLTILSKQDCDAILHQIQWYKKYRKTLQFGTYLQLTSVFKDNRASWVIVSQDKSQAVANVTNTVAQTIPAQVTLTIPNLIPQAKYKFTTRQQQFSIKAFGGLINMISPVHVNEDGKLVDMIANLHPLKSEVQSYVLTGELLEKCGVKLNQEWSSTGYDGNTRVMFDFGSRLYSIDKLDK
ncbi:MAG: alpha-galactosidase [Clostridiales bacterium]|nr:alpha-galactosidase [Clostridiales bacterium]